MLAIQLEELALNGTLMSISTWHILVSTCALVYLQKLHNLPFGMQEHFTYNPAVCQLLQPKHQQCKNLSTYTSLTPAVIIWMD